MHFKKSVSLAIFLLPLMYGLQYLLVQAYGLWNFNHGFAENSVSAVLFVALRSTSPVPGELLN
jgi:hypothetical protein